MATGVGSIAACVVAVTGTAVAVRSGSGSCPHPANTNTLNDSTNTILQGTEILLAVGLIIQITSPSRLRPLLLSDFFFTIIRSPGIPDLVVSLRFT